MRVLIVEDDPVQAGVLGFQLLKAGHSVSTASGGIEAIDFVRTQAFEVILLDLNMPGMSGLDTLGYLMTLPECGDTPVLMLTASSDEDSVARARNLGAAGYIEKPFTPSVLIQKIERVVYARDTRWIDDYHAVLTPDAGAVASEIATPRIMAGKGGSRS